MKYFLDEIFFMSLIDWIFTFIYIYFFVKGLIALKNDDKQTVKHCLSALFAFSISSTLGLYIAEYFLGSD